MKKFYWMSLVVLGFGFVACTKTKEATKPGVVNLAIWSHFVTDEILSDFEKQTGLKVVVSNYASNEELLAKIQAGAEGYDVAVPSDYMVEAMRNLKLLLPLDQAKVANARSLDPKTLKKYYDPENKFSLPFSWGTTGIAYNQKLIKTPIRSWKDLFENKELTGKFTLLDDVRETLGAALKMQAYSLNSKSLPELEKGKAALVMAKKRAKGFTSETQANLINGEVLAAHAYSVDGLMSSAQTKGAIQYVIPDEGCTLWIDNLVIPQGAKNVEGAHKLINHLLDAQVGVARAKALFSAPANKDSMALLPQELKDNQGLFPKPEQLAKCEMLEDLGETLTTWDRIWTEVKAGQ